MNEFKSALASKGVWGGLLASLVPLLKLLNLLGVIKLPPEILDLIDGIAGQLVTAGGAGLGLYGRVTAKQRIR